MDRASFQAQHTAAFRVASSLSPEVLDKFRRMLMLAIEQEMSLHTFFSGVRQKRDVLRHSH